MGFWADAVNEWFDKGYIASGRVLADNQISISPGKVENFGFHFLGFNYDENLNISFLKLSGKTENLYSSFE